MLASGHIFFNFLGLITSIKTKILPIVTLNVQLKGALNISYRVYTSMSTLTKIYIHNLHVVGDPRNVKSRAESWLKSSDCLLVRYQMFTAIYKVEIVFQ